MTRLLTKKQTCEKVGYSRNHIARLVAEGRFPPPVKPFGVNGRALWVDEEVNDWIASKILERDNRSK